MEINAKLFEMAYKKLKSSVYFDKTQLILRNRIVAFESGIEDIREYLKNFCTAMLDEEKSRAEINQITKSISVKSFPKKLEIPKENGVIINSVPEECKIKELQHVINMDVRGHILGVLWVMLIGFRIDKEIYQHSYGNRIRKNLYNELSRMPTYSPYLFEPYFEQYESWRDKAMDQAVKHLGLGQDVAILTIDFKRFYYSVDMTEAAFKELYQDAFWEEEIEDKLKETFLQRLNYFIFEVVKKYASLFGKHAFDGRKILPIGFLPSNVISNWCLKNFDKAVVDGWNPIYFGRYVDDVLIVDKVEHNSDIYNKAKENNVSKEEIIKFFMEQCSRWNGLQKQSCKNEKGYALIKPEGEGLKKSYILNGIYNPSGNKKARIEFQNDKVKIFYFKSGETEALLKCFKENIAKNKSEFRRMPEDEAVFQKDDYSGIYDLARSDTINKFRGIDGVSIDKFQLSKFLGKHLRIGGMIEDKKESVFEKDIFKIFNPRVMIENYIVWEKVVELFVIDERFETVEKFAVMVMKAIDKLEYSAEKDNVSERDLIPLDRVKETLREYFYEAVFRSYALVWKKKSKASMSNIINLRNVDSSLAEFIPEMMRKRYCMTRMVDKSVMPVSIDILDFDKIFDEKTEINLTRFADVLSIVKDNTEPSYIFYPYLVNMYDCSIFVCVEEFKKEKPFENLSDIYKRQEKLYLRCNYDLDEGTEESLIKVDAVTDDNTAYQICVGKEEKTKLKIAVANVKLNHSNFERLVKGNPNRSYFRYQNISALVNQAIDEKADMLIMPESFVPYEWLTTLARTCARNQMAVVTGVEHVKYAGKIFNLTAVILPYKENGHRCAYISFHLKKHYAPSEKQEINGYRLTEAEGNGYELYKWKGCYFPVYCCYELTSIYDRSLFQAFADFIVAIEWNRDVNYYSNILEALSRDLHCYCLQVNSSDYGDSRITKPSRTELKDVIRTKGGINSTILVDVIDIEKLREFQFKEYELQKKSGEYKVTPPDFDKEIIFQKIKGEKLDFSRLPSFQKKSRT